MSSSEDSLAERVAYLEQYTNTLHIVLDHFVKRIRKVEVYTGQDEEGLSQCLEWRGKIEATLIQEMSEHDWDWQSNKNPTKVTFGNVVYARILTLCAMLPVDVQLQCWNKVRENIPIDLPLVWSAESPTHENVSNDIKATSDKRLIQKLEKALKNAL